MITLTTQQASDISADSEFSNLIETIGGNEVITSSKAVEWAINRGFIDRKSDYLNQALAAKGIFLDFERMSDSSVSPFIEEINGILVPNEERVITIEGSRFQPDLQVVIEGATISNVIITPTTIVFTGVCSDVGTHEVYIKNSNGSSKDWNDHFVDCITLPNGAEQTFNTNFSASSQFSTSYPISLAFDSDLSTQWFSSAGGGNQYIQLDAGQTTFFTKLANLCGSSRDSDPYSIQVSNDGNTFKEIAQVTLPFSGEEIDVSSYGILGRYIRILWITDVDYANSRNCIIKGRQ